MKANLLRASVLAAAMTAALATSALAQQGPGYGPGPGSGPGMMGGGMMGGGMMGGGRGPMMGGGNGPGGGYGPGGGPMMGGGYGTGPGGGLAALNLSDEQRDKISSLQEENRRKNWDTMGQMRTEMFKLRGLYNSDDSKAIVDQQRKVDDLRRQMLVSRLEMRKQVEQVLNPEQRKQLRSFGPWWLEETE